MKRVVLGSLLGCLVCAFPFCRTVFAQEANSGFDLRATLTGQAMGSNELSDEPRDGSPVTAGFRSVIYPAWKIDNHLSVTGAGQLVTRPYFYADFSTTGYGAKGSVLQASLNYARVSDKGSVLVRAGELSTAFGSFLLRYDDADNSLIDLPLEYGYYDSPVSFLPVAGAQVDATRGKWDARAQFANSSPANPRSIFAKDQYGNWAGGFGFTIHQGFRVGASSYYGPYLNRQSAYYLPGEAPPNTLRARAIGAEASWERGHTRILAEAQKFVFPYKAIPTYSEVAVYAEVRQVLSPRWYVAVRPGYTGANENGLVRCLESAAGFRVNRHELIKFGYEIEHYSIGAPSYDHTAAVQFVTTLDKAFERN
jgi:hypothetical protein